MNIRRFTFNPYQEHCYLASDGKLCVIIDPGCLREDELNELLAGMEGLQPAAVLLTHAHFDHIYGVQALVERFGLPVYMSHEERSVKDGLERMCQASWMPVPARDWETVDITDGQALEFGAMRFEVIATPGHTPGGVCFLCADGCLLFSGDTLFAGSIGRTDLPWADYDQEILSIMNKLIWLDHDRCDGHDITVYPGHGPSTSIIYERSHNPFLEPFNEKEELPQ